jgi:hypothetical protein
MKTLLSEQINPENYYLQSRVNDKGDPIYDWLNEDISDYSPYKALRKKVFDGDADIVIQGTKIQIYWKSALIAEAELVAQLSDNDGLSWDWQYTFDFADANIQKIIEIDGSPVTPFYRAFEIKDLPAISVTDAVMGMDQKWSFKDTKQAFYLDVPGWLVRIRWQVRVKDSALAWTDFTDPEHPIDHKGLKYNVSDYPGTVNHGSQADPEPGWTQHWWTFEPNGYQCPDADARTPAQRFADKVGLFVDPYLIVDEQATYFDIYQDGFVSRVWSNGSEAYIGKIYDPDNVGTTDWFSFGSKLVVGGTTYALSEDTDISVVLVENTPIRVTLRAQGNFEDSSQSDLSGEQDSVLWMHFYPDKICMRLELNVTAAITLSDNANNGLIFMDSVIGNLANEDSKYESGDSEIDAGSDGSQPSADYIATLADEINVLGVAIENSLGGGTATYIQYIDDPGVALRFGWNGSGTITADTELEVIWILDSLDRGGSAKLYNAAYRIVIGNQYKDAVLDQSPSKGDDITDMIFPVRIPSGTLHSDGVHFYEPDGNYEVKLALDRQRIRAAFVLRDFAFRTGAIASPTDHLLCHLKCDEQAASPNLNDETVNNADGTWSNISDGLDRDTDTSGDSVQEIGRGRNLDTQDGSGYIEMVVGSGTVHDNDFLTVGSIQIKLKPSFDFDDAGSGEQFITLHYDGTNFIEIWYATSSDKITCNVTGAGNIQTPAYTENYSLQREMSLLVSWDKNKGFSLFTLDGQVVGYLEYTGTPTANHPSTFFIGAWTDRSLPADIIIDEIKTFDEAIMPFGAYFIGNGEGLLADIDNPHSDLIFFWDAQSVNAKGASNLATSKTGTLGSANSGGTTSFPTSGGIVGGYFDNESESDNYHITFPVSGHDIINGSKGSLGVWVNWQTLNDWNSVIGFGDTNDHFVLGTDGSDQIFLEIKINEGTDFFINYTNYAPTVGVWYWIVCQWEIAKDRLDVHINGVTYIGTDTTVNSWAHSGTGVLRFGADGPGTSGTNSDVLISRCFISNDPDTPEILTAFGKPLHVPLEFLQLA